MDTFIKEGLAIKDQLPLPRGLSLLNLNFDFDEYEVHMKNVLPPVVMGDNVDVQKGKLKLYSITRLNGFLDDTKGQSKISIASFLPHYNLFLIFSTAALKCHYES